jgi:hypothetical protein
MTNYFANQFYENQLDHNLYNPNAWNSFTGVPPLDYLNRVHFPSMKGAFTTPPAGPYATQLIIKQPTETGGFDTTYVPHLALAVLAVFFLAM